MPSRTIGSWVRKRRREVFNEDGSRMSQQQLGSAMGVSRQTIYAIEKDAYPSLQLDMWRRIATFLDANMSPDQIDAMYAESNSSVQTEDERQLLNYYRAGDKQAILRMLRNL